jgi:hypothetical protein
MEHGPLEVVEPGPVRIARHVEEADRAHQHVALVRAAVVEIDHPDVTVVVPRRGLHGDAEPQVRPKAELVDGLLASAARAAARGCGSRRAA